MLPIYLSTLTRTLFRQNAVSSRQHIQASPLMPADRPVAYHNPFPCAQLGIKRDNLNCLTGLERWPEQGAAINTPDGRRDHQAP
jgi:hypothetical protein